MGRQIQRFIGEIKEDLHKSDVKLELVNTKWLFIRGENVRCMGYFDEEEMKIRCAVNRPKMKWLQVLLHEYAHFTQWKDQCDAWKGTVVKGEDRSDELFLWIKRKKEYSRWRIKDSVNRLQDLELDCEKRAADLLKRFDLPVTRESYVKRANAYIFFYSYAFEKREWYAKKTPKPPYEVIDIINHMPSRFCAKYRPLPKKYFDLYEKHYADL